MSTPVPDLDALRRRLSAQAFLFDDPGAFTAGVEVTIAAVREALAEPAGLRYASNARSEPGSVTGRSQAKFRQT